MSQKAPRADDAGEHLVGRDANLLGESARQVLPRQAKGRAERADVTIALVDPGPRTRLAPLGEPCVAEWGEARSVLCSY